MLRADQNDRMPTRAPKRRSCSGSDEVELWQLIEGPVTEMGERSDMTAGRKEVAPEAMVELLLLAGNLLSKPHFSSVVRCMSTNWVRIQAVRTSGPSNVVHVVMSLSVSAGMRRPPLEWIVPNLRQVKTKPSS
ncbi:hypothetical protein T310_8950 [Rasamsonia emersonii CBS 393.64]|uniref:Uncharacterized protein n=1 Tax=Rasamsonia emersonii (strain ATCC 16479 / CBS 393.64 / IMI 116815) TaxID=1408163 RepID=A0A0F4YI32_RASE3|nr:hypothetical protein T310_8950 [Rasamsonia emersonii CBS 393.64]KKA17273.1 hypothetical protein T310_8950 [Rasamsonia emersonii CBS 393.64]